MEKKWWTLVAVSCGVFMLLLDITIVTVALPAIQHQLHASFTDLQWVVDAYALTLAAMLLTTGSLADMFGRRLLFGGGLAVFTAGSLLCGAATDPLFLVLARSFQGIGGAAMLATSLALLAQAFQGRDRSVAFAVWGTVVAVAVAVGPLLGGVLTTDLSWRWIFFVNGPIGVVALVVTALRVTESRDPAARRPDLVGFALFTACLVALVYGLIRASLTSWSNAGVVACFVVSAVLAVAFVVVERRGRHPMFDLALFAVPTFDGGLVASFCISASIYSLLLYLVLYLQDGLGYSALGAGVRLLVISGGTFLTSALAARLSRRVPVRWLIAPGLLVAGVGVLLLTRVTATSSWTALIPGFALAGLGNGIVNPPLASTAVGVVEPHRAGMASGINNTFRQVGVATGIAALGTIFATRQAHDLGAALHRVPALAPAAGAIVQAVRNGTTTTQSAASVPPALRVALQTAVRTSFVRGLHEIFVIAAVVAFVGAVGSLLLIRDRDFVAGSHLDDAAAEVEVEAVTAT
jgi:EmrB/QacA subfamily drug resistance transporter